MADTKRRRRSGQRLTDYCLNVAVGADLYRRLNEIADARGCSLGIVTRAALVAGLKTADAQLAREFPEGADA